VYKNMQSKIAWFQSTTDFHKVCSSIIRYKCMCNQNIVIDMSLEKAHKWLSDMLTVHNSFFKECYFNKHAKNKLYDQGSEICMYQTNCDTSRSLKWYKFKF